jgi:protein O-GlcNAc transferase
LVTSNLDAYKSTALRLAASPTELAQLRATLARGRDRKPLFNTPRFCRHLESAYKEIAMKSQHGESPSGFSVPAILE